MITSNLTKYPDVNEIIAFFVRGVIPVLEKNVLGIYLTGSLSSGAFNYHSSDIDIIVIVHRPVSRCELDSIGRLHRDMEGRFEKWARRLECSYTPVDMLLCVMPPTEPRPYYWGGDCTLYEEAPYGNEWIINKYFLYGHSIALFGPSFTKLLPPVDVEDVRKACVRDLFQEWAPKKFTPEYFRDSHHEAYFILNLCRILHTVICSVVGSKKMAASWVQENYGDRWGDLVGNALAWKYGIELDARQEAIEFLDFAILEVSKTAAYSQVVNDASYIGEGENGSC